MRALVWLFRGALGEEGSGGQEGEGGEAAGEGGGRGDGGDDQWAAGVAEFAAEFGGAHGLAEPFGRGPSGQRREAERGDQAGADADQRRGEQYSGQAGQRRGRQARRR